MLRLSLDSQDSSQVCGAFPLWPGRRRVVGGARSTCLTKSGMIAFAYLERWVVFDVVSLYPRILVSSRNHVSRRQ
jgi:hypothetical protein